MRYALLLVFLSAACATVSYREPASRVWLVSSATGSGSCVPIAHGPGRTIFLTARHNVGSAMRVHPGAGPSIAVERVESHASEDVAIFWVKGRFPLVPMAQQAPQLADRLLVAGHAFARDMMVSEGRAGRLGVVSASSIFGCSGGLVMNEDGELVGVLAAIAILSAQGFPFAIEIPMPFLSHYVPLVKVRGWVDLWCKIWA